MSDVLDARVLDDLRESVGGDHAFLTELIDELLADAPRQLEALRDAVAAGDAESARRAAHTLKGNARTFGAADLSELALEAENAAAGKDLETAGGLLDAIAGAWEQVRGALLAVREA